MLSTKKASAIWILTVLTFLSTLGTLHAWISWQISGLSVVTLFTFSIEVIPYFIVALMANVMFIGAACQIAFRSPSSEIPLYQLGKDFDEKLEEKSEDIKNSTDEALARNSWSASASFSRFASLSNARPRSSSAFRIRS